MYRISLSTRRFLIWAAVGLILLGGATRLIAPALAGPPGQNPDNKEVRLTEKDDGGQVNLQSDEALVITLEGNPSTGYIWETAGPAVQDQPLLRQVGESQFETKPGLLGAGGPLLGAPAGQTLRFEAVAAGQAELRLVYHRPWEKGTAPAKTFAIQVQAAEPSQSAAAPAPPSAAPPSPADNPPEPPLLGLPASYNWCSLGSCTPIRDQGSCGSCWAFGTVGPLEANILRYDGVSTNLSEQYLLSCNNDGWSCSGGSWAHNYHLNKIPAGESAAGAVYESSFPYLASQVACNYPGYPQPHPHHEKIISWAYVGNYYSVPSAQAIKQAIYDHGPVAVAVCAGSAFSRYTGGIFQTNESSTCGGGTNHAVVLVGWDDSQQTWRLRNSWGTGWGESGYMNIKYGTSNVGYAANYVTYSSGGCPDNYETDDAYTTARSLNFGSPQTRSFHVGGDVDWAKFAAQAGSVYTLTTGNLGASSDTILELYDTTGANLLTSNNNCPGAGLASCINHWTAPANGTYYAKVRNSSASGGCSGYGYNLTATSSSDSSRTAVHLPLVVKTGGCSAVQTVQNGGFEGGKTVWVQQSGTYDIIGPSSAGYNPYNGTWAAWFGGYDNADDRLYQTITFPAAPAARLTLYLYVYTTDNTSYPYDYFHIEMQNSSGQTLETFLWADNRMDSDGWYTGTMTWNDFSAHSGQTRRLVLQGITDYSLFTNFRVDDVTLWTACSSFSNEATPTEGGWQKIDAPPGYTPDGGGKYQQQP